MDSKYILVVISSDTCGVCTQLKASGYFQSLMDTLIVDDVAMIDLEGAREVPSSVPGHEALNFDRGRFPSYKYMSIETYDNLGSISKTEALKKICIFNAKVVNGSFVETQDYNSLGIDEIQRFCNDGAKLLLSSRLKSSVVGPTPRYRSSYSTM